MSFTEVMVRLAHIPTFRVLRSLFLGPGCPSPRPMQVCSDLDRFGPLLPPRTGTRLQLEYSPKASVMYKKISR